MLVLLTLPCLLILVLGSLRTFMLGLKNMEEPLGFPLSYAKSFVMFKTCQKKRDEPNN
jgi:hypothetical protein